MVATTCQLESEGLATIWVRPVRPQPLPPSFGTSSYAGQRGAYTVSTYVFPVAFDLATCRLETVRSGRFRNVSPAVTDLFRKTKVALQVLPY